MHGLTLRSGPTTAGCMKQTSASNVSIGMAALAWLLVVSGFYSQLGKYNRIAAAVAISTGLLCWASALWLSGYGFMGAKLRSSFATTLCVALCIWSLMTVWL